MVELKKGERIDDLQCKTVYGTELKIIQNPDWFCFGIDAVLLSDFAEVKKGDEIIDLGTGTGIIPILLTSKTYAKHIDAVELQKEVAEMAKRSVEMNGLDNMISIINSDIVGYKSEKIYDCVICNPPYKAKNSGIINSEDNLIISRHEIYCSFSDVAKTASKLLKYQGKFFLVHRPERLVDIIYEMRINKIEPKKIRYVQSYSGKKPVLVLIEGRKCGNPFLKTEPPLVIYNSDGSYTNEILKIYKIKN